MNDTTAPDYYVRYKDYIKNVASSEIYATWPDDTGEYTGDHVLYAEQGLYRMVPECSLIRYCRNIQVDELCIKVHGKNAYTIGNNRDKED